MTKRDKDDYGNYILNNKEAILKRKRKIIVIKRSILILILLCTVFITLGFTLPTFNLAEVTVSGTKVLSNDIILTSAAIEPDINIFKVNTSEVKQILMNNQYIESVKITRNLPNKISINIKERGIAFSVQCDDGIYAIDENGRVLGVRDSIDSPNVLILEGIPTENLVVGQVIQGEDGNIDGARIIYKFLNEKGYFEQFHTIKLEVDKFADYRLYVDEAYIKLGTSEDMNKKLAKAFSILSTPQFMGMKGYIDVSFKGNPVVYKEN